MKNNNGGSTKVQIIKIVLSSHDFKNLAGSTDKILENFISKTAIDHKSSEPRYYVTRLIPLPTNKVNFAIRRDPKIYKFSFEKYQYRVHRRVFYVVSNVEANFDVELKNAADVTNYSLEFDSKNKKEKMDELKNQDKGAWRAFTKYEISGFTPKINTKITDKLTEKADAKTTAASK